MWHPLGIYDLVVTVDNDLHPSVRIPWPLARLKQGFDVVYGAPEAMRETAIVVHKKLAIC